MTTHPPPATAYSLLAPKSLAQELPDIATP
jgi:hypothetical protein